MILLRSAVGKLAKFGGNVDLDIGEIVFGVLLTKLGSIDVGVVNGGVDIVGSLVVIFGSKS